VRLLNVILGQNTAFLVVTRYLHRKIERGFGDGGKDRFEAIWRKKYRQIPSLPILLSI
jgi:hypothetical protein